MDRLSRILDKPPQNPIANRGGRLGNSRSRSRGRNVHVEISRLDTDPGVLLSNSRRSASFGDLPCTAHQLDNISKEVILSERSYVDDLADIIRGYYGRMCDISEIIFPQHRAQEIFLNITEIYKFNIRLLRDMESGGKTMGDIASCLLDNEEGFQVYTEYCTKYKRSSDTLASISHNVTVNEFLRRCQADLKHSLPLSSYLLKPVQRILKYHLFMEDALKHLEPSSSSEYSLIERAFHAMEGVGTRINEENRKREGLTQIEEFESLLVGWQGGPLCDYGELLLSNDFRVHGTTRSTRFACLFTSMLLVTKRRDDGTFSYKSHVGCDNLVVIESLPDRGPLFFSVLAFDVHRTVGIFQANSLDEKQLWVRLLKERMLDSYNGSIPQTAWNAILEPSVHKPIYSRLHMSKRHSSPLIGSVSLTTKDIAMGPTLSETIDSSSQSTLSQCSTPSGSLRKPLTKRSYSFSDGSAGPTRSLRLAAIQRSSSLDSWRLFHRRGSYPRVPTNTPRASVHGPPPRPSSPNPPSCSPYYQTLPTPSPNPPSCSPHSQTLPTPYPESHSQTLPSRSRNLSCKSTTRRCVSFSNSIQCRSTSPTDYTDYPGFLGTARSDDTESGPGGVDGGITMGSIEVAKGDSQSNNPESKSLESIPPDIFLQDFDSKTNINPETLDSDPDSMVLHSPVPYCWETETQPILINSLEIENGSIPVSSNEYSVSSITNNPSVTPTGISRLSLPHQSLKPTPKLIQTDCSISSHSPHRRSTAGDVSPGLAGQFSSSGWSELGDFSTSGEPHSNEFPTPVQQYRRFSQGHKYSPTPMKHFHRSKDSPIRGEVQFRPTCLHIAGSTPPHHTPSPVRSADELMRQPRRRKPGRFRRSVGSPPDAPYRQSPDPEPRQSRFDFLKSWRISLRKPKSSSQVALRRRRSISAENILTLSENYNVRWAAVKRPVSMVMDGNQGVHSSANQSGSDCTDSPCSCTLLSNPTPTIPAATEEELSPSQLWPSIILPAQQPSNPNPIPPPLRVVPKKRPSFDNSEFIVDFDNLSPTLDDPVESIRVNDVDKLCENHEFHTKQRDPPHNLPMFPIVEESITFDVDRLPKQEAVVNSDPHTSGAKYKYKVSLGATDNTATQHTQHVNVSNADNKTVGSALGSKAMNFVRSASARLYRSRRRKGGESRRANRGEDGVAGCAEGSGSGTADCREGSGVHGTRHPVDSVDNVYDNVRYSTPPLLVPEGVPPAVEGLHELRAMIPRPSRRQSTGTANISLAACEYQPEVLKRQSLSTQGDGSNSSALLQSLTTLASTAADLPSDVCSFSSEAPPQSSIELVNASVVGSTHGNDSSTESLSLDRGADIGTASDADLPDIIQSSPSYPIPPPSRCNAAPSLSESTPLIQPASKPQVCLNENQLLRKHHLELEYAKLLSSGAQKGRNNLKLETSAFLDPALEET